jgi:2-polyprenyl-6-methoxyphenol hydroxylase-like FAD-dependent oxidoreductase
VKTDRSLQLAWGASRRPRRAIVVGAGIGGLTAAIALRRLGFAITVIEEAPAARTVDLVVSVRADAVRTLSRLGLGGAIDATGAVAHDEVPCSRATLQAALLDVLGPGAVRIGTECDAVSQDPAGASVWLMDGMELRAEVVVGADGSRSRVRASLFGEEPHSPSGLTSWQAIVTYDSSVDRFLRPGVYESQGVRFGIARLPGHQAHWYAVARVGEDAIRSPRRERDRLWSLFRGSHGAIAELLDATPEDAIVRTTLYRGTPAPRLSVGRVALLGEAARQTPPVPGHGAGRATEDALALADALAGTADVELALERYDNDRRPDAGRRNAA